MDKEVTLREGETLERFLSEVIGIPPQNMEYVIGVIRKLVHKEDVDGIGINISKGVV